MSGSYICRRCCQKLSIGNRLRAPGSLAAHLKGSRAAPAGPKHFHTTAYVSAAQVGTTDSRRPREYGADAPAASGRRDGDKYPETSSMQQVIQEEGADTSEGPVMWLAKFLRKNASTTTETYAAYGACELMVYECSRQADYEIPRAANNIDLPKNEAGEDVGHGEGWWHTHLGLPPTFNTWAQVTFLHMYALTCRFRMLPPELAPVWHQHLLNHFFYKAEEYMTIQHAIVTAAGRGKHLKDLFVQWRGIMTTYDEGLVKGDAVLATAIWRNIFKGVDDVDMVKVSEVVAYLRAMVQRLESVPYEDIVSGAILFNGPTSGKKVIGSRRAEPGSLPTDVGQDE